MADRKLFHNSVTPLPAQGGLTPHGLRVQAAGAPRGNEEMTIHFSLELPAGKQAELDARVARGDRLTLTELKNYEASATDAAALMKWLDGQGFRHTRSSPDSTSVYGRATPDVLEKSLQVKMVRVTKAGVDYTAAQNAPSLPADVGAPIHAIVGLQPFLQARKHSIRVPPRHGNRAVAPGAPRVVAASADVPPLPTANIENAPPYLTSEIRAAYGASGLGTGAGQTIAILIDTVPAMSDLQAFWQRNGVNVDPAQVTFLNVTGQTLPATEGEETLDVEWTSGIAPGANIRVYATGSLDFAALNQGLDQIFADLQQFPGMRQVSISLGLGETFLNQDTVDAQHQRFSKLAAAGVNVFVSTGDAGSNPDGQGHSPTGPLQAEYPSTDAAVVAVGGTSLTLNASGTVASEVGWQDGGGGISIFVPRQPWQTGNGVPAGAMRTVPDVSLTADPNLGAFLFLNGAPTQIGGTSWSAPVWAAFCALLNEARPHVGGPLPFLNTALYQPAVAASLRDIVAGSNGAYTAGPGYDLVTGLGVPDVGSLLEAIP